MSVSLSSAKLFVCRSNNDSINDSHASPSAFFTCSGSLDLSTNGRFLIGPVRPGTDTYTDTDSPQRLSADSLLIWPTRHDGFVIPQIPQAHLHRHRTCVGIQYIRNDWAQHKWDIVQSLYHKKGVNLEIEKKAEFLYISSFWRFKVFLKSYIIIIYLLSCCLVSYYIQAEMCRSRFRTGPDIEVTPYKV